MQAAFCEGEEEVVVRDFPSFPRSDGLKRQLGDAGATAADPFTACGIMRGDTSIGRLEAEDATGGSMVLKKLLHARSKVPLTKRNAYAEVFVIPPLVLKGLSFDASAFQRQLATLTLPPELMALLTREERRNIELAKRNLTVAYRDLQTLAKQLKSTMEAFNRRQREALLPENKRNGFVGRLAATLPCMSLEQLYARMQRTRDLLLSVRYYLWAKRPTRFQAGRTLVLAASQRIQGRTIPLRVFEALGAAEHVNASAPQQLALSNASEREIILRMAQETLEGVEASARNVDISMQILSEEGRSRRFRRLHLEREIRLAEAAAKETDAFTRHLRAVSVEPRFGRKAREVELGLLSLRQKIEKAKNVLGFTSR
ncbi:hypothetical protein Efla_003926 [Eimeria flavescens]